MKILRYAVSLPAYFAGVVYALSVEWFERGVDDVALVKRRKETANKQTAPQ